MVNKKTVWAVLVTMIIAIVALFTTMVIFLVYYKTYSTQLENLYERSLYELTSNINDIEVDMSKLIATNSADSQREVLNNIYNNCSLANNNLSCLPIQNNKVDKVNKFINNLGGYAYSLLTHVNTNNKLTEEQLKQVEELYSTSQIMSYEINTYFNSLKFDYSIIKDIDISNGDNSNFMGGLENVQSSASKVPTLIYDGPFSESVVNKEIKGLPAEEIFRETALNKIKEYFKNYNLQDVKYLSDTNGKFETYDFMVELDNSNLYVQLSKLGGVVVNITGYNSTGTKNLTIQECETLAHNFASDIGFSDMYSVWSAQTGDIVYINLAPIVNGIIYYPDLVKVKINAKTSAIIGLDSANYCYNHVKRTLSTPSLSFDDAQKLVSPLLNVEERNLTVISNDYVGETLAYEFICSWNDYVYYVYIDAMTGEECNIMRVIKTYNGDLIM